MDSYRFFKFSADHLATHFGILKETPLNEFDEEALILWREPVARGTGHDLGWRRG
jgi:hypothetical protein